MAAEKDNAVVSDTEGGERPVREQLKKAHIRDQNALKADIDADADVPDATEEDVAATNTSNGEKATEQQRGRLHRKRSYEEVEADSAQHQPSTSAKPHTRKRSRDSTADEDVLNNGQRKSGERPRNGEEAQDASAEINGSANTERPGTPEQTEKRSEATVEAIASPKTKRSRLLSTTVDEEASLPADSAPVSTESTSKTAGSSAAETKNEQPANKVPAGSAFGNTSSASPFGALAGSKSPSLEAQTSSNAFASSGFGSLAASSSSGFGALGKTSGGPGLGGGFASGGKSPLNAKENDTASSGSAFGGGLSQKSAFSSATSGGSAFGSGTSGFSTFGGPNAGGFGSGLGGSGFGTLGGGGLSTFASGKPSTPMLGSAKSAKAFGAPAEDDEEADDAEEDDKIGMKSPLSQEAEKQDERFYEQDLETGEEGEDIEFTSRAKVYNWAAAEDGKKEWRERGIGVLRLNVKKPAPDDEIGKPTARLLMRADGSHRVVLNTPVKKEIKFGTPTGEKPQGGYLFFSGTIDDKPHLELLQLKLKQVNALELWDKINALQETM